MAFKVVIFLLASLLLVTTKVSSNAEETFLEAAYAKPPVKAHAPAPAPVKAPPHAPVWAPVPPPILPPVKVTECPKLCEERCKSHIEQRQCKRACNTCCKVCKCVPPGTYGNKEKCGKCYTTDIPGHGNRLIQCP